jgi:hypothetical protein
MVRRHLTLDYELACVTDLTEGIDQNVRVIKPMNEFLDVRLPTWNEERPQCLRRLSMFRRDAADLFGADRIVCMDLDLIVSNSLDPVLDITEDFRIFRGTAHNRAYNGSLMSIRAGCRPQAYETFTTEGAIAAGQVHVGSDQAWLSKCLPGEATWGPEHGVHWWGDPACDMSSSRLAFFPIRTKPWDLIRLRHEFARKHYRRAPHKGSVLVLGNARNVWQETEIALKTNKFDAVIASKEAAAEWPGPIFDVSSDEDHARDLVVMHGFYEAVFCGQMKTIGVEHGAA